MQSRQDKEIKISRLSDRLAGAQALIIAENAGLTAAEMETLRANLRARQGSAQVVKNTLARRVLADGEFAALAGELNGPLIYGISTDPAAAAKIIVDTAKDNPKLIIRGGVLAGGAVMDRAAVVALASLPDRVTLLTKLAATLQAPIAGLAQALNGVPAGLVRALAELKKKADS